MVEHVEAIVSISPQPFFQALTGEQGLLFPLQGYQAQLFQGQGHDKTEGLKGSPLLFEDAQHSPVLAQGYPHDPVLAPTRGKLAL